MIEKKYRKRGSMKDAKLIKLQVEDDTLIFLEHRSFIGHKRQVGYGKAVDDLCRDFQGLLSEHARLLRNYQQLLGKYSAAYAQNNIFSLPVPQARELQELCSP